MDRPSSGCPRWTNRGRGHGGTSCPEMASQLPKGRESGENETIPPKGACGRRVNRVASESLIFHSCRDSARRGLAEANRCPRWMVTTFREACFTASDSPVCIRLCDSPPMNRQPSLALTRPGVGLQAAIAALVVDVLARAVPAPFRAQRAKSLGFSRLNLRKEPKSNPIAKVGNPRGSGPSVVHPLRSSFARRAGGRLQCPAHGPEYPEMPEIRL